MFVRKCAGGTRHARTVRESVARVTSRKATRALSTVLATAAARCCTATSRATRDPPPGRGLRALASASGVAGHGRSPAPSGKNWSKLAPFQSGRPSVAPSQRERCVVSLKSPWFGKQRHRPPPSGNGPVDRSLASRSASSCRGSSGTSSRAPSAWRRSISPGDSTCLANAAAESATPATSICEASPPRSATRRATE